MNPVDNGTINPDPAPSKALTAINCHIRSESKYNTPLAANIPNPICNSRMLFTRFGQCSRKKYERNYQ